MAKEYGPVITLCWKKGGVKSQDGARVSKLRRSTAELSALEDEAEDPEPPRANGEVRPMD